jgi:branched-subunit amino acid aminotransferase/4-amino-4-deoxychorismate lyase
MPTAWTGSVGTFGQIYHGEAAERAGYDDVLLTGPGDVISESTISNIGFFDGNAAIWPSAVLLEGITMQILSPDLGFIQDVVDAHESVPWDQI